MTGEAGNGQAAIARRGDRQRVALIGASAALALGGLASAWAGWRLFLHGVRNALMAVRFGYRVMTLTLYRRCPDCRRMLRADARLCLHCGYRTAASRSR